MPYFIDSCFKHSFQRPARSWNQLWCKFNVANCRFPWLHDLQRWSGVQVVGRYVHTVITYIHMHTHTHIPSFSTVVALRGQNFRNMDLVASVWIRFVHAVVTSVMENCCHLREALAETCCRINYLLVQPLFQHQNLLPSQHGMTEMRPQQQPHEDNACVCGQSLLDQHRRRLWLFYKPKSLATTIAGGPSVAWSETCTPGLAPYERRRC